MAAAAMDVVIHLLQEANPNANITTDLFILTTNEKTKSVSIMAPDLLAPALLSRERIACKFSEHEDTTNSVDIYTEFSVHRGSTSSSGPRDSGTSVLWATISLHPRETASERVLQETYTAGLKTLVRLAPVDGIRGFNRKKKDGYPTNQVASNMQFITPGVVDRFGFEKLHHLPIPGSSNVIQVKMSDAFCNEWSICRYCAGTLALGDFYNQPQTCPCIKTSDGRPMHPNEARRDRMLTSGASSSSGKRKRGTAELVAPDTIW
jgi:hypothetical protein